MRSEHLFGPKQNALERLNPLTGGNCKCWMKVLRGGKEGRKGGGGKRGKREGGREGEEIKEVEGKENPECHREQ